MRTLLCVFLLYTTSMLAAEPASTAATAINALGIDLLRQTGKPDVNFLISPYSIQSALAMTYAGAEGKTREEMASALHYPNDDAEVNRAFASLRQSLDQLMQRSAEQAEASKKYGGASDPLILTVANRLFGQQGHDFRAPFLDLVRTNYAAPFAPMDFVKDAPGATKQINGWVEEQTRDRIRNLIPDGALDSLTRLVLVNAIYLKAPWAFAFPVSATRPEPFLAGGDKAVDVPTMVGNKSAGFAAFDGFSAVGLRYSGWELQFLILLPDERDGLAALEHKLTSQLLVECGNAPQRELILHLPKFKLEPALLPLGKELQKLGMTTAFDRPRGSANFDRIAPRRPEDYLYISEVYHKTFLKLDEQGTEAAAATAVAMRAAGIARQPPKPIEVKVDRPFLFAIQHRPSGACLFLGHVTDPR
jgi:serpin B